MWVCLPRPTAPSAARCIALLLSLESVAAQDKAGFTTACRCLRISGTRMAGGTSARLAVDLCFLPLDDDNEGRRRSSSSYKSLVKLYFYSSRSFPPRLLQYRRP